LWADLQVATRDRGGVRYPLKLVHINLVSSDPEASASFYVQCLLPDATREWLGDSLHVRNDTCDLAFQRGEPLAARGAHHGFLADSPVTIDRLVQRLLEHDVRLIENETQEGFRSIRFLDPDGYECEIYWEAEWP
jgi:catechol 2,3-dioxygenase-like lactoylglutathione lyase family enzyme